MGNLNVLMQFSLSLLQITPSVIPSAPEINTNDSDNDTHLRKI